MAMGMPYTEYWDGEPYAVKHYREAYKIKQDEQNAMLWLQGLYNYIGVATALNNGFNTKKEKYPEKHGTHNIYIHIYFIELIFKIDFRAIYVKKTLPNEELDWVKDLAGAVKKGKKPYSLLLRQTGIFS